MRRNVRVVVVLGVLLFCAFVLPRLLGGGQSVAGGQAAPSYSNPAPTPAGSSSTTAGTPSTTASTTATATSTTTAASADDEQATADPAAQQLATAFANAFFAGGPQQTWLATLRPLVSDRLYTGLATVSPDNRVAESVSSVTVGYLTADGAGAYLITTGDARYTVVVAATAAGLRVVDVHPGTP